MRAVPGTSGGFVGAWARARQRSFATSEDGVASLELALGAVVLLGVAALCFDVYVRVKAHAAVLRMAVTMADYVSRDTAPSADDLSQVGAFLYTHELGVPADMVYVLTALRKPDANPASLPSVLWTDDRIRIGAQAGTDALALACSRRSDGSLPEFFRSGMASGEVLIVAEVCAKLRREGSIVGRVVGASIYRFHAVAAREPDTPPAAPIS